MIGIATFENQKRGVALSVPILGVFSQLFAYSLIDNSCNFISPVHGLLSFKSLSHGAHLTIFIAIVFGDLISYTCNISDIVLDHQVTVTGIGAKKYITIYIT